MSRRFLQPADLGALSPSAPDLAQVFVSLSSDIALVLDAGGTVLSVAQDPISPLSTSAEAWVGRPWSETVTDDTRRKIERLLEDVVATGMGRRREVNHSCGDDPSVPVSYTAMRLGQAGPVLAVGRDLRAASAIQRRFLSTQQEIERGYWRTRQNEARQRLLLHAATDACIAVDALDLRIIEANRAAHRLLCIGGGQLAGRMLEQQFEAHSRPAVRELIRRARSEAAGCHGSVRLAGSHVTARLRALCVSGGGSRVLLRARAAEALGQDAPPLDLALQRLIEHSREGVVVTDGQGRVIAANQAFARLAYAGDEERLLGQTLVACLACAEGDAAGLQDAVQRLGLVLNRRLELRRNDRAPLTVQVSGMSMFEGDQHSRGYIIRTVEESAVDGGQALQPR